MAYDTGRCCNHGWGPELLACDDNTCIERHVWIYDEPRPDPGAYDEGYDRGFAEGYSAGFEEGQER